MNLYAVLNFVFFQALWFSSVVGAGAFGLDWLAVGAATALAILTCYGGLRRADFTVAAISVAVGVLIDNVWVWAGILEYPRSVLAPYWIALLWFGLGLTVNHSLAWFRDQPLLGSAIVGLFAPVTYLAGERFGAVTVLDLPLTVLICIAWAVLFYGLSRFSRWIIDTYPQATIRD